ncbi:MAG: hypothetical protein AAGK14_14855 [Verrucomicrobiota bacterium]
MSKSRFRLLVLSAVLVNVVLLAVSLASLAVGRDHHLRIEHQRYLEEWALQDIVPALGFFVLTGLAMLALAGSFVGLYLFFAWGRYLYTFGLLASLSILVLSPPFYLLTPPELVLLLAAAMLEGAIFLAIWTDPLRHEFRGARKELL